MSAKVITALDCDQPCDRCKTIVPDLYAMRSGHTVTLVCVECRELMQGEWRDQ